MLLETIVGFHDSVVKLLRPQLAYVDCATSAAGDWLCNLFHVNSISSVRIIFHSLDKYTGNEISWLIERHKSAHYLLIVKGIYEAKIHEHLRSLQLDFYSITATKYVYVCSAFVHIIWWTRRFCLYTIATVIRQIGITLSGGAAYNVRYTSALI